MLPIKQIARTGCSTACLVFIAFAVYAQDIEPDETAERAATKFTALGGWTIAQLYGSTGTITDAGHGFFAGFDFQFGRPLFLSGGLDFFRNTAGRDYFNSIPVFEQDPVRYMQGFRVNVGVGGYPWEKGDYSLSTFAILRIIRGNSLNSDSRFGPIETQRTPALLSLGGRLNYRVLTLHISFDLGVTPVVRQITTGEEFKYRAFLLGLGVNF